MWPKCGPINTLLVQGYKVESGTANRFSAWRRSKFPHSSLGEASSSFPMSITLSFLSYVYHHTICASDR